MGQYKLRDFFGDLCPGNIRQIGEYSFHSDHPKPIDIPSRYLINDDIKATSKYIIGTTHFLHDIMAKDNQTKLQSVHLIIIPNAVQSYIDENVYYKHKYLKQLKIKQFKCQNIEMDKIENSDIFNQELKKIYADNAALTIFINRKTGTISVYNEFNNLFDKISKDYSLSFDFELNNKQNNVKSHIYWGCNQRVRFFPQMMHSLLPNLFNKQSFNGTDYQRLQFIHSQSFKNGIAVNMNDPIFADLYKKYTNYDLIIHANYDRVKMKIKNNENDDENKHDDDDEKETKICNGSGDLKQCKFISNIINLLKSNKESSKL